MPITARYTSGTFAVIAVLLSIGLAWVGTRTAAQPAVDIDSDDIGGIVRGPDGPRLVFGSSRKRMSWIPSFARSW